MEGYVADWLSLLVRWLHVTAGIAWIGASFYFIWLDNHLEPPKSGDPAIRGEVWSIHGGGFYHNEKFVRGPSAMPETLHWFKWEAYTTWLSGMGLLAIVYWWDARAYLVDPAVSGITPGQAIAASAALLVLAWIVYDVICRTVRDERLLGGLVFGLLALAAWGTSQIFSARASYMLVGAMIGTIMVWNVFFVIIPGQRRMVAAVAAGEPVDPEPGLRGKQRSVHNNYLTLPVLFIMTSSHYPMTYGHRHGWLVLVVLSLAGVLIRHYFNLRHQGRNVLALPVAAGIILAFLAWTIAPTPRPAPAAGAAAAADVTVAEVHRIVQARCVSCHGVRPTDSSFSAAPAGVMFDTEAQVRAFAARIHERVVVSRTMPLANGTGMTDAERERIGAWFSGGQR